MTNKKIKKNTIKGNRVDEASLSGAGTALSVRQDTAAQVPAASGATTVLTLQVPAAGNYVITAKGVLAKGGGISPIQCLLTAGGDSDRSLEFIDATHNDTIVNTVVHAFPSAGTAVFACDNPSASLLLVTDKVITAIPVGAVNSTVVP